MAASQNVGALAAGANIEDALDFLLEEFLAPEVSRMPAPCHLVIGLPGAGKTTYLAMLGEMLHHRDERYHFPFRDLDVRRLDLDAALDAIRRRTGPAGVRWSSRALAPRVRDLVFDFARKVYAGFIARQQWAPATRRDESYFLVSELSRERRPLARLVTLEASGEEYREMLRALGTRNPAATRPSIRCLKRLLDLAEGLVVLVDPSYERNDELYHTLFLALKEDLEPRARNALKKAVRERLERATEQSADQHRLERARDYQRRFDAWLKRVHDARAEIEARLVGLERTLVHEDAVRRLTDADLHALGELEKQIEEIRSEEIDYARRQRDKASAEGGEHQALGEFYRRMVRFALSNPEAMLDMARTSMGPPPSRPTEENTADIAAATDAILHAAKLPAGFLRFTAEELNEVEPERRFVRLRHVALVVTKTDLYPVIHPPELFPKQRLPVTWQHLRMVDAYLRLVGGGIRYYNASATGYAVYQDGMFSPGKEMTLTPINVVEPLFHMLGLSGG